jgi:hypothetical protein
MKGTKKLAGADLNKSVLLDPKDQSVTGSVVNEPLGKIELLDDFMLPIRAAATPVTR